MNNKSLFKSIILIIILCTTSLVGYEYQFGIVMIFRDEGPFLKEWIEYHRAVGAEHFWLFDNLSKDNCHEILKPYIDAGIVELFDVPVDSPSLQRWNALQTRSYNRGLAYAKGRCKWVAVIDADEYVVPINDDTVTEALKSFEAYPGVALNWMIFGTSFVDKIPPDRLMMEMLTLRGESDCSENRFVKLIVQPDRAVSYNGPHMCSFKNGQAVNTHKVPVKTKSTPTVSHDILRINHYWSRDMDYLINVKMPRSRISGGTWAIHMEKDLKLFNLIPDDAILRFIPKVKSLISQTP